MLPVWTASVFPLGQPSFSLASADLDGLPGRQVRPVADYHHTIGGNAKFARYEVLESVVYDDDAVRGAQGP